MKIGRGGGLPRRAAAIPRRIATMAQKTHGNPPLPEPRDINNRVRVMQPFQECDRILRLAAEGKEPLDPGIRQLTEQLCMRILVKHHGWTVTSPGFMQRRVG